MTASVTILTGWPAYTRFMRFIRLITSALILAVGSNNQFVSGQTAPVLTVFAAASLTDSFTEIGQAFDAKTGGKTTFQFAGSQALRTQLENGAKADVYASANAAQFDPLVKSGLVVGAGVFTKNRLVVIVPKKGNGRVKTLADLATPGVKLVIADKTVPVGVYARQVFDNLEKSGRYGSGYAAKALKNVVSEETNVRQVALKVQLGEADAGVVYSTDVTLSLAPLVIQIAIPARSNVIASYPIGTLKVSSNAEAAKAFTDFVRSSDGQAILGRWGFLTVK
jgi:molybdate transport system substrate-binding protein